MLVGEMLAVAMARIGFSPGFDFAYPSTVKMIESLRPSKNKLSQEINRLPIWEARSGYVHYFRNSSV